MTEIDTSAEAAERMCVACGTRVPASHDRAQPGPGCPSPDACTFDLTPHEAWQHWRAVAHQRAVENTALRAERDAIQAAARDCFNAQTEIDETWDAIGTRGNRAAVSLSEQVASLCRELDDGSFYKEADIDALMSERDALRAIAIEGVRMLLEQERVATAERDALRADVERLRRALRPFVEFVHDDFRKGNAAYVLTPCDGRGGGWIGAEDLRNARAALTDAPATPQRSPT